MIDPTILTQYQHTREHASVFDVTDRRGTIRVTGRDAARFLHNLCTNDVLNLPEGTGCEAFFTTAQARVISPAIIDHVHSDDGSQFVLEVPRSQAQRVFEHLDRHLISEAVELWNQTEQTGHFHVAGPEARRMLEALGAGLPDLNELQHVERMHPSLGKCRIRRRSLLTLPGYDVQCDVVPGTREDHGSPGAPLATHDVFEILRIEAGIPEFGADIDEQRLAFDIGRNLSAICFTKGCFLGQEPIVMARDRGHANYRLLGLIGRPADTWSAPATVHRDGKEVGKLTSAVLSPKLGRPIGLAYLRRGHQDSGTVVEVIGTNRWTAEVSSLPFPESCASGTP